VHAVDALSSDARKAMIRRLIRTPASPIALVHTIRLLGSLSSEPRRHRRCAQRLLKQLATSDVGAKIELLIAVAMEALLSLHRQSSAGEADRAVSNVDPNAENLLVAWYHAHQFVTIVAASGKVPDSLDHWVAGKIRSRAHALFSGRAAEHQDVATPNLVNVSRFVAGALQYISACPNVDVRDEVQRLSAVLTSYPVNDRLPHVDLIRDLSRHPNALEVWLQPRRESDGSMLVSGLSILGEEFVPSVLLENANVSLATNLLDLQPWAVIEAVAGDDSVVGNSATQLERVIAETELSPLFRNLREAISVVPIRLARQAVASGDDTLCKHVRDACLTVIAEQEKNVSNVTPRHDLTELELAVMEALYILTLRLPTQVDAIAAFANDLSMLSRANVLYLQRVRTLVEELVLRRPLREAQACVDLLLEARAV
jgi:hypothetical protein